MSKSASLRLRAKKHSPGRGCAASAGSTRSSQLNSRSVGRTDAMPKKTEAQLVQEFADAVVEQDRQISLGNARSGNRHAKRYIAAAGELGGRGHDAIEKFVVLYRGLQAMITPPTRHIVALGGGGFSMESSPLLDDYILGLARRERPRICFVPTASGDSDNYVVRFYKRFSGAACEPTHLELFRRNIRDLAAFARAQDIFYVGGGNTVNMIAIWRLHGFDQALRTAYDGGAVLAGISAGSLCWYESGLTDSFAIPELSATDCLGFLPGSHCPHYDSEPQRRPAYQRMVANGMPPGVAADDSVALHYVDEVLHRVVSSRPSACAYRVERSGDGVTETVLPAELLAQERAG